MRALRKSGIPRRLLPLAAIAVGLAAAQVGASRSAAPILDYIRTTWKVLTRSPADLASAAVDPKFHPLPNGKWPVYVSRTADIGQVEGRLKREMTPAALRAIEIRRLPENPAGLGEHGLLYLPRPYVVPGGRFNEMYGWDSYFIQVGLLRDGEVALAKDLADNFLYEIREYGKILNANRTYYLTRSQPPFLTQMVLGVFQRTKDRQWLREAVPEIEKYYRFWTSQQHQVAETGLSRYFDLGEGPAPEVVAAEKDAAGRTHYELVKEYFRTHQVSAYDVAQYYDRAKDQLTPLFYKGDRSMRESGFDPSERFGPFSVDIIHYNPVCLNSLLYLLESQAAEILNILGRKAEAGVWQTRANERAGRVNRLLWSAEDGLYYDYDFVRKRLRKYPFLTTFYPLWAGFATRDQAARVAANVTKFERPGGLVTSLFASGNQWDAPFAWAPLEMIAVQGLRRYGFHEAADRVAMKFLSMVREQYAAQGTIVEKYDVVRRTTQVSSGIRFGYRSNEAGFGWTNAAFTVLLDELSAGKRQEVLSGRKAAWNGGPSFADTPGRRELGGSRGMRWAVMNSGSGWSRPLEAGTCPW
ncbi:MAG TPA: trehalase family glycosidase [Bryobacteraceae bacterium]|nr:trehalase family glycosidase [Bryobacteraceae bacterium]